LMPFEELLWATQKQLALVAQKLLEVGKEQDGGQQTLKAKRGRSQVAPPPTEVYRAPLLTPRQRDVLAWLHRGMRPRAIAQKLSIQESTVRSYIRDAGDRLGTSGGMQTALEAHRLGLLFDR